MRAAGEADEFTQPFASPSLRSAAFAAAVAIALLAVGPWAMDLLFGSDVDYGRFGLALIAVGMGLYLAAATLNQAALARGAGEAGGGVLGRLRGSRSSASS